MQKLGPCYSFAKEMEKHTTKPIGLIVNARGGSSINQWMKGAQENYFREIINRVNTARKYGEIKAILWHQGEADTCCPDEYKIKLKKFVNDLREELELENLLFIAGEISHWDWTSKKSGTEDFNEIISSISSYIPNSDFVSSYGLTPLIDESDPHYDSNSQLILGKRYAEKVLGYLD